VHIFKLCTVNVQELFFFMLKFSSSSTVSLLEIFQLYYHRLVRSLPMDDALFLADLYGSQLFPGNLKKCIEALSTAAERAMKFLDAVIEPAISNNEIDQFKLLLMIMNNSDNSTAKKLAEEINGALNHQQFSDQKGKHNA